MLPRFILFAWGSTALIFGFVSVFIWRDLVLGALAWLIATIAFGCGFILYELAILARLLARLNGTRKSE